jgi:hypothetical protein
MREASSTVSRLPKRRTFGQIVRSQVDNIEGIAANAGISSSHLCNLVHGRFTRVSPAILLRLADTLGLDPKYVKRALAASREEYESRK